WCTGKVPVIFLRVALGHDPALSPSGRASGPIAKARTGPIEGASERFAFASELQFGAFGKVCDEADVQCIGGLIQRESTTPQPIARRESRMAGIGGGRRVTSLDCGREPGPGNRAGVPAAPNILEPVGPCAGKRKPYLDIDCRLDHDRDLAKRRQVRDWRRCMGELWRRDEAGRVRRLERSSGERLGRYRGNIWKLQGCQILTLRCRRGGRCSNSTYQNSRPRQHSHSAHHDYPPFCDFFTRWYVELVPARSQ